MRIAGTLNHTRNVKVFFDYIAPPLRPSGSERPSDYIRAMVCGYPKKIRLAKSLVMLVAYFDESVSEIGTKGYVLAGYVQSVEVWEKFSDEWATVLEATPTLKSFHMSEAWSALRTTGALRDTNSFFGWEKEQVQTKLDALTSIIRKYRPWSIECRFSSSDFKAHIEKVAPYDLKSPWLWCYFGIIQKLAELHLTMGLSDKVEFVFDKKDEEVKTALFFYQGFTDFQTPAQRAMLCGSPQFKNDEDIVPLQAADILVWALRRDGADASVVEDLPTKWSDLVPRGLHHAHRFTKENFVAIAEQFSQLEGIETTYPKGSSSVTPKNQSKIRGLAHE
jgi:hypothetical protein